MLKIGMFDSGVGGLSILKEVHKLIPDVEVYYIADIKFAPYGEKSQTDLVNRAKLLTEILLKKNVSLITLACNTVTAAAIKGLRESYDLPFVGVEPYLNAFNREINVEDLSKIAVLTTKFTASSEKFWSLKSRLDPENKIVHEASGHLAGLIEDVYRNGLSKESEQKIKAELDPLKGKGYEFIILGCTHYPLIKHMIENYLNVKCVAPGRHIALRIEDILEKDFGRENCGEPMEEYFYLEDISKDFIKSSYDGIKIK